MDRISKAHRSWNMSRIRGKDTTPERLVRSALHRMGYRFRLHRKDLPGKPDIVLPKHRVVIFVHGCFWHRHPRCRYSTTPKTNRKFWNAKFKTNVERDRRVRRELRKLGWKVVVVWECQVRARSSSVKSGMLPSTLTAAGTNRRERAR
jgi:DNA mismatch endonuclease (patch repair protein)